LIPRAYLRAWSAEAPWPDLRQVEQDLIICRALCDLFNVDALRGRVAFRGGTAINKLLFQRPLRYSDDIDLVQVQPGLVRRSMPSATRWPGWARVSGSKRGIRCIWFSDLCLRSIRNRR
jgi:predicted nucleotidyltransferase component of viral defense system